MKTQRNLLLFPAVAGWIFGIFAVFAPRYYIQLYNVPINQISASFIHFTIVLGIALAGLGIIAWWMRSLTDISAMKGAMVVVSIVMFLMGLENVFVPFFMKDLPYSSFATIHGILFLVIAVVFYLKRNPNGK